MQPVIFVTRFFASKHLSLLTAFVCWSLEDSQLLVRSGLQHGIRVRVLSVHHDSVHLDLLPSGLYREGVLLDSSCLKVDRVLLQASKIRAFNSRFAWLILHEEPHNSSFLEEIFSGVDVLPDAEITWSSPDVAADLYRVKTDQQLLLTYLGLNRNVTLRDLEGFWAGLPTNVARRKDLKSVRLKAATIVSQPQHFKGWSDLSARQIDTFPKVTYPIMMLLGEDLNFRYNIKQVDLYGEEHNGSFDGLAGILQRCEAELGIASVFLRADRWKVLHYTAETIELRGAFMFRQPVQAAVTNVFVLPFSGGVWAASAAASAGAALLLALLARALTRFDPTLGQITPSDAFTFAIGTICQQGFSVSPSLWSARLVMFSTLLLALFVFTAYSAKIVSILQAPSDALRTIADLEKSSIGVAVQDTTYKRTYFAESTDPATQRLYRKKLLPLGDRAYLSVVDGIERMRTQFFAFQVEESSGYDIISKTFTEHEKCGLKQIQAFKLPMVAVPVRKYSGYKELVAVRLRWQREVGVMSRWRRVWMTSRPRCDAAAGGFSSISLSDVLPTVQVLAMGVLISLLLLAGECAVHKYHNTKSTKLIVKEENEKFYL